MIKKIQTNRYIIVFNTKKGTEMTSGVNGYPDPFLLDGPSLADIGIKGNCSNNNCKFCYQGNEQRPDMSLSDYKKIVDQLKPYTNQIALGGKGNPNEHLNFKEIIDYTVENGIVPNYTTSGYNLTDEQIEISKKCGAVAVSIGNMETYTFDAIKRFQNAGIKTNLHWVASKESFCDIINVLQGEDIWHGMIDLSKINAIVLLSFKNQGRGKNLDNWRLDDDDIKKLLPCLRKNKSGIKIGADSCLFCRIGKIDEFTKIEKLTSDTCEASRYSMYVGCDMMMMPCSYGDRGIYGVSLNDNIIKEVWDNSSVFKDFREKLINDPFKCPYGF